MIPHLQKLKQLTNQWGIYQHGKLRQPNPEFGYALEDQARALLVTTAFGEKKLSGIYFNFILNSLDSDGQIYQYFYDDKNGLKADKSIPCSEDALGMVAWALLTVPANPQKDIILKIILNQTPNWHHLRSRAYLLLGLLNQDKSDLENKLTQIILKSFKSSGSWHWFEDKLTYGNALLPWSLWKRAKIRHDQNSLDIAKISTNFLLKTCQENNVPMPVSHLGIHKNDDIRLYYDQQPIEAAYMICCLTQAFETTNDIYYQKMAQNWWNWFWGNNLNQVKLIDDNFACFDALTAKTDKVNQNQGAESNICFLMAYLAIKKLNLLD